MIFRAGVKALRLRGAGAATGFEKEATEMSATEMCVLRTRGGTMCIVYLPKPANGKNSPAIPS